MNWEEKKKRLLEQTNWGYKNSTKERESNGGKRNMGDWDRNYMGIRDDTQAWNIRGATL